jgi:hypothetical protein
MGYHLTNLYSISPDDKHSYFVFYIGNRFDDTVSQWIDRNFSNIAKSLGHNAVIVRGLSDEFDNQVVEAYHDEIETIVIKKGWDKNYSFGHSVDKLLSNYKSTYGLGWQELHPLLFVTDKNPSAESGKGDEKIFYLIPLGQIKAEGEIREITESIIYGVQSHDFSMLDKVLSQKFGKTPLNLLSTINQSLELKPNIAGVGINLNAVIDWIVKGQKG